MAYEQRVLSFVQGFGRIISCSRGSYHIRLSGVSLHLNEKGLLTSCSDDC